MYVPPITSISTALRIYWENPELNNDKICELFEGITRSTLTNIKNPVKKAMAEKGIKTFGKHSVNTKTAFEIWGLDVDDLEMRMGKLSKLGLKSKT